MKKFAAFLSFLFALLAACGPSAVTDSAVPRVDVVESPAASAAVEPVSAFAPATAVSTAAVIREQDHIIGAEEPVVAIIEYGDYQ